MTSGNAASRGSALLGVLALMLVVQAFVVLMLLATGAGIRAVADQRWAIEGRLVALSVLAEGRPHFATGAVLPEGMPRESGGLRPDGWRWFLRAERWGAVVRLAAIVERRHADGVPFAGSRATLLLRQLPSDTLQRLHNRPRF